MKQMAVIWGLASLSILLFCAPIQSSEAPEEERILQPRDTLIISVLGRNELSQSLTIPQNGKIIYPFIGEIEVKGLTPTQLEERITQGLKRYFKNPQVSVTLAEGEVVNEVAMGTAEKKNKIYILGEVEKPGVYEIGDPTTVLEALSLAGSFRERVPPVGTKFYFVPDLKNSRIIRVDGAIIPIDLGAITQNRAIWETPLFNGDVLYIPSKRIEVAEVAEARKNKIYILGEVEKPGVYEIEQRVTLLEALSLAGVPAEKVPLPGVKFYIVPDLEHTKIVKANGQILVVNIKDIAEDKVVRNTLLFPGDTLFVPSKRIEISEVIEEVGESKVYILGEVARPGVYPIGKQIPIVEALAVAGGVREVFDRGSNHFFLTADLEHARITRATGEILIVDLARIIRGEDKQGQKIVLFKGDTLYLPKKRVEVEQKKVYVLGEVQRPGVYEISKSIHIVEALSRAGGPRTGSLEGGGLFSDRVADPKRAQINRANGQVLQVDLTRLSHGELSSDWDFLMPGDTLYIPSKKKFSASKFATILSIVGSIAAIATAVED